MNPTPVCYDVTGGTLHALRFGDGPHTALAAHGITSSAMAWPAVADALPTSWSLVALDLRGRGVSRDLPGPFGLRAHAADLVRVAEALDRGGDLVLTGHSMGAYVAVRAAHHRPELFCRLVLVDGGVALPFPEDADADEVLDTTLGPAITRLRETYPTVDAYVDFFRSHPALGPFWNDTIEDYVRYDALDTPGGIRSRAVEDAVRADGRDLLVSGAELDAELRDLPLPVDLLVAPAGMFGQPPGLLPAQAVSSYGEVGNVCVETVPDTNHYTILFASKAAERVAAAITQGVSMSAEQTDAPAPIHRVPADVDDATVEAVGKLSEALETTERARGHLYSFHQLTGGADLQLGEAVDQLRKAGHPELADRVETELVGRNVIEGRWTFQIVEDYDDGYWSLFRELERTARDELTGGRAHLHEAAMKEDRRTHGHPDHAARP
ncbi:MAG: alpha/beta fold hydrolase [Marmoricola sp.]